MLLFALTAGAYLQTVTYDFVWDDQKFIVNNLTLRSAANIPRYFTDPTTFRHGAEGNVGAYRPLRNVSYLVDYKLFGLKPGGWHATNVLLHACCAVLLFAFLKNLAQLHRGQLALTTCELTLVWCSAAVWALHPVNSEVVAWVKSRDDILCALFVLSALAIVTRALLTGAAGWLVMASVPLLTLGACLGKETGVALPLMLVAVLLFGRSRFAGNPALRRRFHILWISSTLGVIAYVGIRHRLLGGTQQVDYLAGSFAGMMATMCRALMRYLRVTAWPFWPTSLLADYSGYPLSTGFGEARVLMTLPVLGGIAALFAWAVRRAPMLALGMALYAIALGPVMNVVPMMQVLAERFLYIPLIGFSVIVMWALLRFVLPVKSPIIRAVLPAAYLTMLVLMLQLRLPIWSNSLALFHDTYRQNPSWRPAANYGRALLRAKRYTEAREVAERHLPEWPELMELHSIRGIALSWLDKPKQALSSLNQAIALAPDASEPLRDLAEHYVLQRDWKNAAAAFEKAAGKDPRNPELWFGAARAHIRLKQPAPAAAALEQIERLDPTLPELPRLRSDIHALPK